MVDERSVLVLAQVSRDQRHALIAEAAAAAYDLHYVDSLGAAVLSLATRPPGAVLVDLDLPEAEELCRKVRTKRRAVDIAIFGLARHISAETFARALRWGVDDVSSSVAEGALASRLVALPADPASPPVARGDAVVATRDDRELVVGRLLSNAGFDVEYARDPVSLQQLASLERMRLVVMSEALGSISDAIRGSRKRGSEATWIVLAPPDRIPNLERTLAGIPRVGVVSQADPFEHILFVSNELAASASNARRERRVLHGALVRFRSSPNGPVDHGFTYNVSPGGLYVRTLAPPVEDRVHVEVLAPNTDQLVQLEGMIAWRRGFARLGSASAPPGFGMKITGGSEADRATWARGCTQLLVARHAPEKPPRPTENDARAPSPAPIEERPRLSEIEELDSLHLDSIQPDSIRLIEEASVGAGGTRPLAQIPKAPAMPVVEPQAAPAADEPTRPAKAEPREDPPPQSDPLQQAELASPPPALPATDHSTRLASKDAQRPRPEPAAPSAPAAIAREPDDAHLAPAAVDDLRPATDVKPSPQPQKSDGAAAAKTSAPAPKPSRKLSGGSIAVGLGVGCLLALLSVVAIALVRNQAGPGPVHEPTQTPSVATRTAPKPAAPPSPSAEAPASPIDEGEPGEARAGDEPTAEEADAGALEADDAGADAEAPEPATPVEQARAADEAKYQQPTPEISDVPEGELMHYEAYFLVESSANARVYSNGIDVGPTNAKNKVRCGLRNVRLGDEPGKWRTEGYTVQIECAKHNRIRLEPTQ